MRWLNGLIAVLGVLYPVIVLMGLKYLEPRWIGLLLFILVVARLTLSRVVRNNLQLLKPALWGGVAIFLLALGTMVFNHEMPLKLYPVVMNIIMLVTFGITLKSPPSMIERLARLQEPNLPDEAITYTKKVTIVWVFFFAMNGVIAAITAIYCSFTTWVWYNGFIAYLLMGLLFAGEWCIRQQVKKRNQQC
ncbi:hypothetical protein [Spartinivicinus poritis]|uniref:DNA gyrase subunit B n=1 Tax=Spartinivicinus poritis TaxID=2994640 RepID=A0ABT5U1W6_9GAMM|nr:hypothetical protein [Spartinivicinus sp. A2-2]MDE1460360.1 hypothetical protein [Spartinivicinus sp. A2-2]